jgi:hypothetical protein
MKAMMEELAASGLSEEEILEKTQVSHSKFLQLRSATQNSYSSIRIPSQKISI